jgi:hypothetical protein
MTFCSLEFVITLTRQNPSKIEKIFISEKIFFFILERKGVMATIDSIQVRISTASPSTIVLS